MNIAPPEIRQQEFDPLVDEIAQWLPILRRLGISGTTMRMVAERARASRTTFKATLLALGIVGERQFYEALAAETGLPFLATVDPRQLSVRGADCLAVLAGRDHPIAASLSGPALPSTLLIAPDQAEPGRIRAVDPAWQAAGRMAMTTPTALRAALMQRAEADLTRSATQGLFESEPEFSARLVVNGWQAFTAGAVITAIAVLFALLPVATFVALHVAGTVFFFACASLRTAAALLPRRSLVAPADPGTQRPVYSVLVAVYHEAEIVPQLLVALSKLQWPRHRLEIKLICEADDHATLAAIGAHRLRSCVEVIKVPPSQPRTKPKALRYALPLTSGEFIVLYDAEDRPHPLQLEEAWRRFEQNDQSLACLQAPLDISSANQSPIARMFAFEYAGLFRGLLPWLAALGQVLPLGGTSNHFRRNALEEVGGWDPHNVAEDADLGVRLARHGYRIGTMILPTIEEPPDDFSTWRPQRTRWYKGWLQSWLVHMRSPRELLADLGGFSFVIAQVLLAGMVFSALLHPVIFVTALVFATATLIGLAIQPWQFALLAVDLANLAFSYFGFWLLGWRSTPRNARTGFAKVMLWTPIYWLLQSYAAWLAVWELIRSPHHWNKTPHRLARVEIGLDQSQPFLRKRQ